MPTEEPSIACEVNVQQIHDQEQSAARHQLLIAALVSRDIEYLHLFYLFARAVSSFHLLIWHEDRVRFVSNLTQESSRITCNDAVWLNVLNQN